MSDRMTLIGLAFATVMLTGATVGFFAYEFSRQADDPAGIHRSRIERGYEVDNGH